MTHPITLQFCHRINEDGTIDSICCDCFLTVATAGSEAELQREERIHRCEPWRLEKYKTFRRS